MGNTIESYRAAIAFCNTQAYMSKSSKIKSQSSIQYILLCEQILAFVSI